MPGGRNPKYVPELVKDICSWLEQGDTVELVCRKAGIEAQTFYRWMKEKSEFNEAVNTSKALYEQWRRNELLGDAHKSLRTLICGHDWEEVKTESVPDASGGSKIVKVTRTTKHVAPNATALIFALSNLDPERWKNKFTQEVSGKIETNAPAREVEEHLSPEAIEEINRILDAQGI